MRDDRHFAFTHCGHVDDVGGTGRGGRITIHPSLCTHPLLPLFPCHPPLFSFTSSSSFPLHRHPTATLFSSFSEAALGWPLGGGGGVGELVKGTRDGWNCGGGIIHILFPLFRSSPTPSPLPLLIVVVLVVSFLLPPVRWQAQTDIYR